MFGYHFMAFSMLAIAVIGFLVWGHHMFVSGQSMYAGMVFSLLSFVVAVPSAIKVFNWTATLYKGDITFEAPMLYALGFIGLFTIGGLTGLFLAAPALDVHLHRHLLRRRAFPLHHGRRSGDGLSGGASTTGGQRSPGRMYPEGWARFAAILIFFGFNLTFFPQFILGYLGMPRRYHSYPPEFQVLNVLSSAGASILALAYLLPVGLSAVVAALRKGGRRQPMGCARAWNGKPPPRHRRKTFCVRRWCTKPTPITSPRHECERHAVMVRGAPRPARRRAVRRCGAAARGRHARHVGVPCHRDPILRRAVRELHDLPRPSSPGVCGREPSHRHASRYDRDSGAAD